LRTRREIKPESVRLVKCRGVNAAQAARDLDAHENGLRKRTRGRAADPQQAFSCTGMMKIAQAEFARLGEGVVTLLRRERDML
jgi:transposase